jgi:hypothetical protein
MSLRDTLNQGSVSLPSHLQAVLAEQPSNVDRRAGAELITRYLFPVSYRSLEAWQLPTRHVNGRAIVSTATLFKQAYARFAAAPVIVGGRRTSAAKARTD